MAGNRRSIRLPEHDYSSVGAYFVTICTEHRQPVLRARSAQQDVDDAWRWLARRFATVTLDDVIVMPDHIHFVIWLQDCDESEAAGPARERTPTLGRVVGAFKTVVAQSINARRGTIGRRVWQRNYFERVVRDDDELERVREYIRNNPLMAHEGSSDDHAAAWRRPS
jgi:REP element-mobilizing transposase RayT